jgi:hypothetical protein
MNYDSTPKLFRKKLLKSEVLRATFKQIQVFAMPRSVDWYRVTDVRKSALLLPVASTAHVFRLFELEDQDTMLL